MVLALLKHAMEHRDDLKVVVMPATIILEKFTRYFNRQDVFGAPGQALPCKSSTSRKPRQTT